MIIDPYLPKHPLIEEARRFWIHSVSKNLELLSILAISGHESIRKRAKSRIQSLNTPVKRHPRTRRQQ